MTLPLVIVNPASADGATREAWPKFASDLRTHFGPFTVVFTEGIGHGRGLAAEAAKQVLGNWFGGEPIRIHFGKQLDLSEFIAKKDHVRTYKEIGEFVMSKIAELAENDRQNRRR